MALDFMEGWDLYGTTDDVVLGNWDEVLGTPVINLTGGMFNGHHVELNSTADILRRDIFNVVSPEESIVGFHFKVDTVAASNIFLRWTDTRGTNIELATLRLTASGAIEFRDGSGQTLLGDSPVDTIVAGTWYTIEAKMEPSPNVLGLPAASGTFELRVNGTTRIGPLIGLAIGAATSGATAIGKIEFPGDPDVNRYDDIYIFDSNGPLNNDFAGDFSIQTLRPASDTATASWTALGGGDHFEEVDDVTPDNDGSYISSQETSAADIYELTNLTGDVGSILGYGPMVLARRESGSTQNIAIRLIGASETVDFGAQNLAETYEYRVKVRNQSVDDASDTIQATVSEVNALQAGVYIP